MNKTQLIFKHEFSHVLKKRGFIIMTLIVPLVFIFIVVIMHLISTAQMASETKGIKIGYVDKTGGFMQGAIQGEINISRFGTSGDAFKAMKSGDIEDYFVIPKNYISSGRINLYSLKRQTTVQTDIQVAISDFLVNNMLVSIPKSTIDRVKDPATIVPTTLKASGTAASNQGGLFNFMIPGIFSILLAMSMVFSSTYMLQGLGEEKENRIMEVLLSSVSPRQLLTGKVLGLSAAGLIQVVVWVISMPFLIKLISPNIGVLSSILQLPAGFLTFGVVYFILGYLLFAILAATVGAISPTTQEGQQLSTIYTLFALIPVWGMSLVIKFPESTASKIMTIFPLTAPVMVMERLGLTNIPVWEIVVSIAVLVLTIIGGLLLATKVFRAYLLSYGKRPKLKEILHS